MRRVHLLILFLLLGQMVLSQSYTLSGKISDKTTGDYLIGASLYVIDIQSGVSTDEKGEYVISLPKGRHRLVVSYTGYVSDTIGININQSTKRDFSLISSSTLLSGVEISAEKNQNLTRIEPSVNRLSTEAIKSIPAMMGEVDVIKALQFLPGVQLVVEGSSNFSVRGGGYDQNLILLDEAPVYSSSHLLGFFSVFNNDAISDVKLYKGDIPVSFGGRLSSLMEVKSRSGDLKRLRATGSIGTIASKITLETPVITDKMSLLLSARRTYADLFLRLSNDPTLKNTTLYFYDLNAKLNWEISPHDRLSITAYFGRDYFRSNLAGISFGNRVASLGWRHDFSNKLMSNITIFTSRYNYALKEDIIPEFSFDWESMLNDIGGKLDFDWLINDHNNINFGYQGIYRKIVPGKGGGGGDNTIIDNSHFDLSPLYTMEHALFVSHSVSLAKRLNLRYGIRFSMMNNLGNDSTVYSLHHYAVRDSFVSHKGKVYATNAQLEPRLSLNYSLSKKSSLKASYSHSAQYLQIASNSTAGSPLDIWFSASNNVKPQLCDQFVLGYFHDFLDGNIETSAEIYYKNYTNVIDFKERAYLLGNKLLEKELRPGKGYSYGFEIMVAKTSGRFNGWISYTFARSFRKIDEVNGNEWYRSPYDKPHNLSVVANYELNPRLSFSASWIYSTGQPVTYPEGRYWVGDIGGNNGVWVPIPSKRNAYRFPDFHRLDLSATWKLSKPSKRIQHELNISLYNAYARKNPWTIFFVQDKENPNIIKANMMYLFSIVPAISWNFRF